ncbi:MAG: hypothetical protein IID31_09695 [Planctomycetes bacterium]|nr:hypothetical protein [Planctomycetota bacterium]
MKSGKLIVMCAAGFAVACPLALAGPGDKATGKPTNRSAIHHTLPNPFANPEQANFTDNFDSYVVGRGIAGLGGWELWPGGLDGVIDDTQSFSPANSLVLLPSTDLVQRFTITSGVWEFTIQTYMPSSAPAGEGLYLIMLNQYGALNNWSMQVALNDMWTNPTQPLPWMIESQFDGAILPLILDQWVEFRAVIDLDNDTWDSWYGGTPLSTGLIWTNNSFAGGPGIPEIAALDLYSAAFVNPEMYLDSVSLIQLGACPCACDFDPDPLCDIFDFLAFQNLFVVNDPCACHMDPDPLCDIFDFLAFQNEFVLGCP